MNTEAVIYLDKKGVLKIEDKRNVPDTINFQKTMIFEAQNEEEQEKLNKLIGEEYCLEDFEYNIIGSACYRDGKIYIAKYYSDFDDEIDRLLLELAFKEHGYNFKRLEKVLINTNLDSYYLNDTIKQIIENKEDYDTIPDKEDKKNRKDLIEEVKNYLKVATKDELKLISDVAETYYIYDILFKEMNKVVMDCGSFGTDFKVFDLYEANDNDFIDFYPPTHNNFGVNEKFGFINNECNINLHNEFLEICKERFNKTMKQVLPKIFQIEGLNN